MIIVKIGGAAGLDLANCCSDIARVIANGEQVVVIHGGSDRASALGEALGYSPRYIYAPSGVRSRYTDARTLEIFTMALAAFNTEIVTGLQQLGVNAAGLSGVDGQVLYGRRKTSVITVEDGRKRVIRDDNSGTVESANGELLRSLLAAGLTPVLGPPAYSSDGPINVDADRAAAVVARTLGADRLVLLTNVPGLLRDISNPESLITQLDASELDSARELAAGRMRIKLMAAQEALTGGVTQVTIADGRRERPLSDALAGHGTRITARALIPSINA